MAFSIDGIASGLDTTTMINQLMQLEARPQGILKAKASATQSFVTALQQLNTKLAALTELATKTAKPEALNINTATSTSEAVTVITAAGSMAGSLDFTVKQTAQAQLSVTAPMTVWSAGASTLTISAADGTLTEIDTTGTLDDAITAINKAGAGVTAVKVATGATVDGAPEYRLQFSATASGTASQFAVHRGTAADVTAGTAVDVFSDPLAARIKTGQDAQLVLYAGTPAEQTVSSPTNTFSDLLPGVSITVTKAAPEPVSVTVGRNAEAATTVAKDLVESIKGALSFVSSNAAVTPGSTAGAATRAGVFTGDSSVRSIAQSILTAATGPIDGRSTSEFGITLTRSGSVEFDAEKFAKALAADPVRVEAAVAQLAERVARAGGEASDKFDGAITLRITGQESAVRNLNDQVSEWDLRLEKRRTTLERTYSALEVQLSKLQSQGDWLSSQLAGLQSGGAS
ncbi:flagellar filament capping protein FliD [Arthrobacter sp. H41]|uniref:flagellar filament capping protein FliD n=1 Tax=Arthrobacter sp. H41 TaxID=1312978 RepID=UPI00047933F7|nr:flagellar filament capping protein FliD [Arthrobacter sp. H41]